MRKLLLILLLAGLIPAAITLKGLPPEGPGSGMRHADSHLESPLLQNFSSQMHKAGLQFSRKTLAVTVQHLVGNTLQFYALLADIGILPENTFVLGKRYSANPEVRQTLTQRGFQVSANRLPPVGQFKQAFLEDIEEMWTKVQAHLAAHPEIEEVLIFDDGGRLLSQVPPAVMNRYRVAGVEMTKGAHFTEKWASLDYPIALACSSYAKKEYSSPLIIDHIRNQIRIAFGHKLDPNQTYGVVGIGMMGFELVEALLSANARVITYDIAPSEHFQTLYGHFTSVNSLAELYNRADVIFGATGKDHAEGKLKGILPKSRTLISLTSEDREFGTFLRLPSAHRKGTSSHDSIHISDPQIGNAKVLNGGFPINFHPRDQGGLPEGHMDIHFLMSVVGAYQAMEAARQGKYAHDGTPRRIAISATQQQEWAKLWLQTLSPQALTLIESYARTPELETIRKTSQGTVLPSRIDSLKPGGL